MIRMAGIVLIVLGILALVYQEFTYTETKQDAQIGSLKIQHNETESVPLPPVVGAVFVAGGVAALFMGTRRSG
jgi:uncharacterized membrane protein